MKNPSTIKGAVDIENTDNPISTELYINMFHKSCIRIGTLSYCFAFILSFIPAIVLWIIFGIVPTMQQIVSVAIVIFSASIAWLIVEPISYFPILGTAGSYMAFLVGGLNMRVPSAITAQTITNSKPGTQRGEIMATMGIAGSVVATLIFVSIGAIGGSFLISNLPSTASNAFRYVPVTIYSSLFSAILVKRFDHAIFGIVSSLFILKLAVLVLPYYLLLILNVLLCAFFGFFKYKEAVRKKNS